MKPQMSEVYDDASVCPLSVLWLVNFFGYGFGSGLSGKLTNALMNAEIPLYYVNEDFDSKIAFNEYRLSDAVNAEARMQATCAEFDGLVVSSRETCSDYFANSVCDGSPLSSAEVPLWFGAQVSICITLDNDVEFSETVRVASLFVKLMDVKSVCQLQGISRFYWPAEYPTLQRNLIAAYRLENCLWRRVAQDRLNASPKIIAIKDTLIERRIHCVLAVLKKNHYILGSGAENPAKGKRPSPQRIYEWVKSDQSFCNHGCAGRAPISDRSFNQLWKEQLRDLILGRMGLAGKKW